MNYKYLGEAIALLGIAYSIFRWIVRNAPESDRPGPGRIEMDIARPTWPRAAGGGRDRVASARAEGGATRTTERDGRDADRGGAPTPTPDPEMLSAAALMFGMTPAALIAMDPRERALLLSGYRAARKAAAQARADREGGT